MNLSRREFVKTCAGCAVIFGSAACTAVNSAPTIEADASSTIPLGGALASPGDQIKVRKPNEPQLILVWRTTQGYGAATIVCTHRGSEVHFNAAEETLDCPSHGSRFSLDGKVVHGPAKQPLKAYRVRIEADRLKIQPI